MPRHIQLTQSQLIMVFVVENVHQIGVERMYIIQLRKILNDLRKTVMETLLGKLHFAHIKSTNSGNFVVFMDYGGSFPLSFRQHNVDETLKKIQVIKTKISLKLFSFYLGWRDNHDLLEVVQTHVDAFKTSYTSYQTTNIHLYVKYFCETKFFTHAISKKLG